MFLDFVMRSWSYNVLYVYRHTTNPNDDDDDDDVVLAAAAAVKRVVETAVVSRGRVSHNSNMVYCNILD